MKFKILSVVTIIIAVLWSTNVFASTYNGTIYEDTKIPGIYYYKHREDTDTEKYEYHNFHSQAAIHRRSSDRSVVYCIESWKTLTGSKAGDFEETTDGTLTNLSMEQIDHIKKLAYFGYGYQDIYHDHRDPKWYAVTQYLIWLVQAPSIEHYFVDSMTSTTPLNIFTEEIKEINDLVDKYTKKKNIDYNEVIMLGSSKKVDVENIYSCLYDFSSNLGVKPNYQNNTVEVTPYKLGDASIIFTQKYDRTYKEFKFYLSDKYQNTMSVGYLEDKITRYNFQVKTGTIELHPYKEDIKTKEMVPLNDVIYTLIAKEDIAANGMLLYKQGTEIASSESINGTVSFSELPIGKYFIKESSDLKDYYDSNKIISINIKDSKTIEEDIYYHHQKLKVNLKKYLTSPIIKDENIIYSLITKEGITFGLFNEFDELIAKSVTNQTGDINFDLLIPYGNYYIKEVSTFDNYYLSDFILPIKFERGGRTEYQIIGNNYEIINYHKKGNITITKRDKDTKEPLVNVKYTIYNSNKEIIKTILTDAKGEINITLPYGNYYLKELSTLDNYELDSNLVSFSITSEIQNMELTNKRKEIKKEEIKNVNAGILTPNLEYQPIEVELSKTDDNSFIDILFYLVSSACLILYRYVKKITI